MIYSDAHCDTIVRAGDRGQSMADFDGHLSLDRLLAYQRPLQVFAVCLVPLPADSWTVLQDYIAYFHQQIQSYGKALVVRNKEDVLPPREDTVSAVLSVEGADPTGDSAERLEELFQQDVRAVNLTWNRANVLSGSNIEDSGRGLSAAGFAMLAAMNRLGMAVDVSHLSDPGFRDVCVKSQAPFMASHSNCRGICAHPRNLTDEQIKAVGQAGGFVGVNLYADFLVDHPETDPCGTDVILRHLDHLLNLAGEDHVGLGTDFDGMSRLPAGIEGVADMASLYCQISDKYGKILANKVFGDNLREFFYRVL